MPPRLGLAGLTNRLAGENDLRRVVVLTSDTTGNPALGSLDLSAADLLVSVQYSHPLMGDMHRPERDLQRSLKDLASWRYGMDLAVVDPFHTYAASLAAILAAADLVRPGGLMLVHDCLPPPELIASDFRPGAWCGVTFAAFRDVCAANEVSWCTVANDFGIGILRVPAGGLSSPNHGWTLATYETHLSRYLTDPYKHMRAVHPDQALEACGRLLADQDVEDLLYHFAGWNAMPEMANATTDLTSDQWQQIRDETARLRAENAEQQAWLIETSRPTWQARALMHSVPRAVRRRVRKS